MVCETFVFQEPRGVKFVVIVPPNWLEMIEDPKGEENVVPRLKDLVPDDGAASDMTRRVARQIKSKHFTERRLQKWAIFEHMRHVICSILEGWTCLLLDGTFEVGVEDDVIDQPV